MTSHVADTTASRGLGFYSWSSHCHWLSRGFPPDSHVASATDGSRASGSRVICGCLSWPRLGLYLLGLPWPCWRVALLYPIMVLLVPFVAMVCCSRHRLHLSRSTPPDSRPNPVTTSCAAAQHFICDAHCHLDVLRAGFASASHAVALPSPAARALLNAQHSCVYCALLPLLTFGAQSRVGYLIEQLFLETASRRCTAPIVFASGS
jgi:hypothetical protein